jgi:hypothetical protein
MGVRELVYPGLDAEPFTSFSHSFHPVLMYPNSFAATVASIANLIGESGERAYQPLPVFVLSCSCSLTVSNPSFSD